MSDELRDEMRRERPAGLRDDQGTGAGEDEPTPPPAPARAETPRDEDDPLATADPERLAGIVGRQLARRPDSAVWSDERFFAWSVRESIAEAGRARPWSDARVLAAGEALRARVEARRLGLTRAPRTPRARVAPVSGSPADVLRDARAQGAAPAVDLGVAAGTGRAIWDEPCDTWIELPPDTPPGQYVALRIVGDSMEPVMHTGDTILVRVETRVRKDTVIVARHPEDGYVCKRVRRVTRAGLELESLAPDRPLLTIPRDERLIVGTVVLVWCAHGADAAAPPR